MSDFKPTETMMLIIKIVVTLLTLVWFVFLFNQFSAQVKFDDLERFYGEMRENLMTSPMLTDSRYIFSRELLNNHNQDDLSSPIETIEFPGLKGCEYAYFAEIDDLKTGEHWEFGFRTQYTFFDPLSGDEISRKTRISNAGIRNKDNPAGIDVARLTMTIYNTKYTQATCAIEKAFYEKSVQTMRIEVPKYSGSNTFAISYKDGIACMMTGDLIGYKEIQCRPTSVLFQDLTKENIDSEINGKGMVDIKMYPIKKGNSAVCGGVENDDVAGKADDVSFVLVCAERIKE